MQLKDLLSVLAACGSLLTWSEPSAADDFLTLFVGNLLPSTSPPLTEADEQRGAILLAPFSAHSIDFIEGGSLPPSVGDNVSFPSFNARFFSDTETTSPTFTPMRGAITRTVAGERAGLQVVFSSELITLPRSDHIEYDLITPDKAHPVVPG
jgi:hypothetical protein